MITDLTSYKNHLATVAADLDLHFVFGSSERILMQQLGDIEYPCLWLGKPSVRLVRDGGLHRKFVGEFWLLDHADVDDYAGQDAKLNSTFILTEKVLQRLQADADAQQFIFEMSEASSDPKEKFSADDCLGWVTDFTLLGAACETEDCCN